MSTAFVLALKCQTRATLVEFLAKAKSKSKQQLNLDRNGTWYGGTVYIC